MVIGRPSLGRFPPTLSSRSTGPHPFVDDNHARSLTWSLPAGGSGGMEPTMRSSLAVVWLALCCIVAVAVSTFTLATGVGAVTLQVNVADSPPTILSTLAGVESLAVQPVGRFSAAVTSLAAGPSAGTLTVAVAVNCRPGLTDPGTCRPIEDVGGFGILYRAPLYLGLLFCATVSDEA